MTSHDPGVAWYDRHAPRLAEKYDGARFEAVHGWLLPLLGDEKNGAVLDVGAGTGRDAAWFAAHGFPVVAIEPSAGLRAEACERHPDRSIEWLDERLPDLKGVRASGRTFSLILLSAVWMHVTQAERARAFETLVSLLRPRGLLAVTLRLGEPDTERGMAVVTSEEVVGLAGMYGLEVVHNEVSADALGRSDVAWGEVAMRKPA